MLTFFCLLCPSLIWFFICPSPFFLSFVSNCSLSLRYSRLMLFLPFQVVRNCYYLYCFLPFFFYVYLILFDMELSKHFFWLLVIHIYCVFVCVRPRLYPRLVDHFLRSCFCLCKYLLWVLPAVLVNFLNLFFTLRIYYTLAHFDPQFLYVPGLYSCILISLLVFLSFLSTKISFVELSYFMFSILETNEWSLYYFTFFGIAVFSFKVQDLL